MRIRRQAGLFIHLLQSLRMGIATVVNYLGMGSMILPGIVNNVKQYLWYTHSGLGIDKHRLDETVALFIDEGVLDSWYTLSGEGASIPLRLEIQIRIVAVKG